MKEQMFEQNLRALQALYPMAEGDVRTIKVASIFAHAQPGVVRSAFARASRRTRRFSHRFRLSPRLLNLPLPF